MTRYLAALALALTLTACGGDDAPQGDETAEKTTPQGAAAFPENRYTTEEIGQHIGGTSPTGDAWYELTTPDGTECEVMVIDSPQGVEMYAEAGDVVATNPTRTAGAKVVSGDQRACHEAVTEALSDLE